ncbi:hypothetical protein O5O45_08675 [Hahella aquimaris]|uniref:hypothetical protein n=1 Tax=Hahella sp. HNIBRBA332 TaxID=3015983 RepID=UPI00273C714C|nr:hypothetical protein [Hahella sp. HNIBRBA332]WLQ15986.1 hypothetical protein O5O45_08675 [Hahella sp. HNIBRBA332]
MMDESEFAKEGSAGTATIGGVAGNYCPEKVNSGDTDQKKPIVELVNIPNQKGQENCPTCKTSKGITNSSSTQSYDDFFSNQEKAELEQVAKDNPDLKCMFPDADARYKVIGGPANRQARKRYETAKKKAELKGEYHHPMPIKLGGCPIHQKLVKKPDDKKDLAAVNDVDDKITEIYNKAIKRHTS